MTGAEWGQATLAIAAGMTIANNIETAIMLHLRERQMRRAKQMMDEMGRSMAAEAMIELSKHKAGEDDA